MKSFTFILTSLLILLASCNQENINNKNKNTFSRYPISLKNMLFDYYIKPNQEFLNLNSIYYGVDSFEMRIYVSYALTSKEDLYLIKATKDSLIKSHYYFIPQIEYHPDGTISKSENSFAYMKKFSFVSHDIGFINLFNQSKISSISTQDSIKNLVGGCMDGVGYTIEIATKNSYRLINYGNPFCYKYSTDNENFGKFIESFLLLVYEKSFDKKLTLNYLISN